MLVSVGVAFMGVVLMGVGGCCQVGFQGWIRTSTFKCGVVAVGVTFMGVGAILMDVPFWGEFFKYC